MRDYRDAKAMAQTIRAVLAAKGMKTSVGESLELIAKAFGAANWNTLAAAIKRAEAEKAVEAPDLSPETAGEAAPVPDEPRELPAPLQVHARPQRFSMELEATLHRSVALAAERKHGYTTLEHLLLALTDDPEAAAVLDACGADLAILRATTTHYVDERLNELAVDGDAEPAPTAGFHRVIQRAMIHVQSAGRHQVTGANILVAIFSERESHACAFLEAQHMNRYDAVNFIAHGIRPAGPDRRRGRRAP